MTEICSDIIASASAWKGADLQNDRSWIYEIGEEGVAALVNAYQVVTERGLISGQFTKDDFPLGAFGETLAAVNHEIRDGRGFAVIRGFPVDRFDLDQIKVIYWGIGCHMGTVLANNVQGEFVSAVTDAGSQPHNPDRRGNSTNKVLDPHTDPTDIVALLCIEKAKEGGESSLASSVTVHNEILRTHPEYLPALYQGFARDERAMDEARDPGAVTPKVPVYEYTDGQLNCFFARKLILDGARKAGDTLSDLQHAALDAVYDLAIRPDLRIDMMLEPGDMQIINNFRTLHARTEYQDHDDGRKRYLLRMWINIPGGTQLSPEFAAVVRRGILPKVDRAAAV